MTELRVKVDDSHTVTALLQRPAGAWALLVFGHGAGAGMRHAFMQTMADLLAARGVATLRYTFPYMEKGSRRPDPQPLLLATVRAAVRAGVAQAADVPVFAGGKSMGGRMTSLAEAASPLGVRGIVFFGFPLHPAGGRDVGRAEHLSQVAVPLLFLQGTRDALAPLDRLEPIVRALPRATLHVIDGADHGFHVLKRSGRTDADVLDELADRVRTWTTEVTT